MKPYTPAELLGDAPVFSCPEGVSAEYTGMTTRTYIAIKFMAAMLGNNASLESVNKLIPNNPDKAVRCVASVALRHADALLEALTKSTP